MAKPTFSIITPTLNEEKFYPRLLEDLVSQTFSDFELIHVDGSSEDKTVPLAQKFGKKLPHFTQLVTKKRNVAYQRNLGAKKAKGKHLLFIDADTQLPDEFLEGLSYQLHRKPADTYTTWSEPDSDKTTDKSFISAVNLTLELSRFLDSPIAIGVFMGCTRDAFKKIGGFKENVTYGEDEDFVKDGSKKGLSFMIYRRPRFVYSLRRFRKEGTLPTLTHIANKRLKAITNGSSLLKAADYKMGGHVFKNDDTDKAIFQQLDTGIKLFRRRPKLQKFLQDLLTFQEIDE